MHEPVLRRGPEGARPALKCAGGEFFSNPSGFGLLGYLRGWATGSKAVSRSCADSRQKGKLASRLVAQCQERLRREAHRTASAMGAAAARCRETRIELLLLQTCGSRVTVNKMDNRSTTMGRGSAYYLQRIVRRVYKRLGIVHLGRRRVRDLIDFIEDRKIDTVIDVGANVGQFGESLRAGGFRGKIVSFEPTRSAFQALSKKAAADGDWEAHHCGLGACSGTAVLHASKLSVFNSLLELSSVAELHDNRMEVDHTEKIPICTLDYFAGTLSGNLFLKIDTQGYERQVIEGARQTISRTAGILMELPVIHTYQGEWQFHEALKYMFEAGFVPAQMQAVGYHGLDKVSAVEFDCLFRPRSQVDGLDAGL